MTSPPKFKDLPEARSRTRLGGPELETISLTLEITTPILGGGTVSRKVDAVDFIRAASIRGALRMWWRALNGPMFGSAKTLAEAERALWGGATDEGGAGNGGAAKKVGGRSEVEVRVLDVTASDLETDELGFSHPAFYALWTAKAQNNGTPAAERRTRGTRFTLEIRTSRRADVEPALRAWLLFGGYGSRTRRGCGSLTIVRVPGLDVPNWLPTELSPAELKRLFGNGFVGPVPVAGDMPLLAGSALVCGASSVAKAEDAWCTALNWLRDFRQGKGSDPRQHARESGDRRPGRSRWPEADKLRRISGAGPWAHPPRADYQGPVVWPRASFGLPIVGQFQGRDANNVPYPNPEPGSYELRWFDTAGNERSRLASPLIVKAVSLADGRFVPVALWLNRAFPAGRVELKQGDNRSSRSRADFDQLLAPGDKALFGPLESPAALAAPRGSRMKIAFIEWLVALKKLRRVI